MWKWSQPEVQFNESQKNGWNENEPNDSGTENCGTIWTNRKWADLSCNEKRPFVCYDERNSSHAIYAKEERNWTDAQNFCRSYHTDLLSGAEQIKNLNGVKKEQLFPNGSKYDLVFFGLFRDAWQWSDGNNSSFRFWNLNYDDEKNVSSCVMLNEKGRWNSEKCTETHHFVCHDDHVILINESRTWEEALYYCRHHYNDLITITNLEEQRWVQEKTKNATTPYVWTGLRYTCTLGFWFWVSDEVVRYKNWASPEQVNECDMSGAMETGGEHKQKKSSHVIYAKDERNWTDAQSFCRNNHTDLISGPEQMKKLNMMETQQSLSNLFSNGFVYIGLFRDAWQWSDGSRSSFRFWNLNYDDEKNVSSCVMLNEERKVEF
ncbi:C-type mannose receptor 2 [Oryzias melastigma]|uniref:C-type mannose receptor 2 n=1 Tax=Oryzias melastigma TaxID=30732 RepID=A0A834F478_ORYME|nr:C-type mannose receptor 2 [Oryzias melastigma]